VTVPSGGQYSIKNFDWAPVEKCPVCDSSRAEWAHWEWARDGKIRCHWYACSDCGLHYQNPMMTDAALGQFYREHYSEYVHRGSPSLEGVAVRLLQTQQMLLPFFPKIDRALEIGSGYGYLLWALRHDAGAEIVGIEPDNYARQISIDEFDIPAVAGMDGVTGQFDLIICTQTMEHLPHPTDTIRMAREKFAAPGCRAYFEVPNRNYREVHILSFDMPSFRKCVELAGWTITEELTRRSKDGFTHGNDLVLICHA